jgi:hypothetical protein
MQTRSKDKNGDAELIAAFLRGIEGMPVLLAARETGLDAQAIQTLRRGYTGELRVTTRERMSSFLLRSSLPPVTPQAPGELVWSDNAPTPVSAPARLGEMDGYGVAEIATRSGTELLVFGVFFPPPHKAAAPIPPVTRFRGFLIDGSRSAEIEAPVRIETLGSGKHAGDSPIYFGGRVRA